MDHDPRAGAKTLFRRPAVLGVAALGWLIIVLVLGQLHFVAGLAAGLVPLGIWADWWRNRSTRGMATPAELSDPSRLPLPPPPANQVEPLEKELERRASLLAQEPLARVAAEQEIVILRGQLARLSDQAKTLQAHEQLASRHQGDIANLQSLLDAERIARRADARAAQECQRTIEGNWRNVVNQLQKTKEDLAGWQSRCRQCQAGLTLAEGSAARLREQLQEAQRARDQAEEQTRRLQPDMRQLHVALQGAQEGLRRGEERQRELMEQAKQTQAQAQAEFDMALGIEREAAAAARQAHDLAQANLQQSRAEAAAALRAKEEADWAALQAQERADQQLRQARAETEAAKKARDEADYAALKAQEQYEERLRQAAADFHALTQAREAADRAEREVRERGEQSVRQAREQAEFALRQAQEEAARKALEIQNRADQAMRQENDRRLALEKQWADQKQEFLAVQQRLQSAVEASRRLIQELRQPIQALQGFAQILELDNLPPDQQQQVRQILRGSRHVLDRLAEPPGSA